MNAHRLIYNSDEVVTDLDLNLELLRAQYIILRGILSAESYGNEKLGYAQNIIRMIDNINQLIKATQSAVRTSSFWKLLKSTNEIISSDLGKLGDDFADKKITLYFSNSPEGQLIGVDELSVKSEADSLKELFTSIRKGNVYDLDSYRAYRDKNTKTKIPESLTFSRPGQGLSSIGEQHRLIEYATKNAVNDNIFNPASIENLEAQLRDSEIMHRVGDESWADRKTLLKAMMQAEYSRDAETIQRICMYIRVTEAKKKNYTHTVEDSSILERHFANLTEVNPIIVETLEYGRVKILKQKEMHYEGAKGRYAKVRIMLEDGIVKDILLGIHNAVVGDPSRKSFGAFGPDGKLLLSTQRYNFTILSIRSNKIHDEKIEPTLTQKASKVFSSFKNKAMGIFGMK